MKKYVEAMNKTQFEMNSDVARRRNTWEETENQIGKLEKRWKKYPE